MKMDDDTGGDLDEIWLYYMPVIYHFCFINVFTVHYKTLTSKDKKLCADLHRQFNQMID